MPVDKELSGEYAAGAFMTILRFFARWKVIGIENSVLEDVFMGVALVTYSAITTLIHVITQYGSTIGRRPSRYTSSRMSKSQVLSSARSSLLLTG